MQFGLTLIIGLGIVAIISFVVGINLKYYNKATLKFHNKEIDISNVTINFKDYTGNI